MTTGVVAELFTEFFFYYHHHVYNYVNHQDNYNNNNFNFLAMVAGLKSS